MNNVKAKLWNVRTKDKRYWYWGDKEEFTINARNIDECLRKVKKVMDRHHWIYEVEHIATED